MKAKIFSFIGMAIIAMASYASMAFATDIVGNNDAAIVYANQKQATAPAPQFRMHVFEVAAVQTRAVLDFSNAAPARHFAVNHYDNIVARSTFARAGATHPDWALRYRVRARILV